MNSIIPATPARFADLELTQLTRVGPRATPIQQVSASAYRQRWLFLLIVLTALAIGALITWNTPRTYTAQSSVQLEQQAPQVMADPDLDPQPNVHDSDRFLQTQVDRVRSRSLAEMVHAKVQANNSPAYFAALNVETTNPTERRERAISKLQDNVRADLGLNTRLAQISFTSRDPVVSATVANAFADALVQANLQAKRDAAIKAERYLVGQIGDAKGKLESSERRMLAYARSADLTNTVIQTEGPDNQGGSLRAQQLGALTDSLSQATARRIDAQQRWAQVRGTSAMSLPEVQENRAVQDLFAQRAQFQAALQEERQRHTDDYPSVREAAAKIQELDSQIGSIAGNIKSSFAGRYAAAAQQERQLAGNVGALRGATMAERERSVGFNSLKRQVETNKAFYDGLLARYKQVATALGAPAANVRLVDRAAPPLEPSSPNVVRNMALAGMSGLILALLAGAVRERMHNVIRTAEDVENGFNLPSLGVVPTSGNQLPASQALEDTRSVQSEAYHSIAVALQELTSGSLPKTLLITSSTASEGKSTSALGIARSLTAMGKRVLLVDGDLRHPSVEGTVGQIDGPGFSEALTGAATAKMIVRQVDQQGFNVVGSGDAQGSPVSLLSAGHMKGLLDKLAAEHDIVIIDGPPIMGLADAVLLARGVDAVLVVVEANKTQSTQLDVAISRLPASNIIGAVITKFDARTAGVNYGDTNYYKY